MSSNRDLLESISADMALETPQALLQWEFRDDIPDIDYIRIRRSAYRYPESTSEGDAVLDEAADMLSLRTYFADTTPLEDTVHYYSVFFEHKGPWSLDLLQQIDIERLGQVSSVGESAATNELLISARSTEGEEVIWSYDYNKELATRKLVLDDILGSEEVVKSVVRNVVGATEGITFVTSSRLIIVSMASSLASESEPRLSSDEITASYELDGRLSSGYEVTGAGYDSSRGTGIMDAANQEFVVIDNTGTVLSNDDVSAFTVQGSAVGVSHDSAYGDFVVGYGKVAFIAGLGWGSFVSNNLLINGYPVRQDFNADFLYDGTNDRMYVVDPVLGVLQIYDSSYDDSLADIQVEEPMSPVKVLGLWRFDETGTTSVDQAVSGNDGTLGGTAEQGVSPGKFNKSVEFKATSDYVEYGNIPGFSNTSATIAFWYKAPYEGYIPTVASRVLFEVWGNATNYTRIAITSNGELECTIARNSAISSFVYAIPSRLFDRFTHIQYDYASGTHALYINGVLANNGSTVGSWTGGSESISLGSNSGGQPSAIGFYDDFQVWDDPKPRFTRYSVTTIGNRCHALSGRDPDSVTHNFRNELKSYFGDFILRNDYLIAQLPQDTATPSGQVVSREDSEDMILGHLGRTARLFGLFLDRNVDRRRVFMDHLTPLRVEDEFMELLGQHINADDFDEDWNVDQKRRFLEVMFYCYHRGGNLDSFVSMARFLGFRLHNPPDGPTTIFSRYKFDSVSDPLRPDVPFDTGVFDTTDGAYPLTRLQFKFFEKNYESSVGATSVPATRQLTDAGASFDTDAEVGSMIFIHDVDDEDDNGQYLITNVVSPTVVAVDRDWPVGSLAGLTYHLHWRVPNPDPYVDSIFTRFSKFKSRWQRLEKDPT